jgi:hypothetical protein
MLTQWEAFAWSSVLNVYLVDLTAWNVCLISVLQYIPPVFLYNLVCSIFGKYCLRTCSLVCCLPLSLVFFNFAGLGSCIRSWIGCCGLQARCCAFVLSHSLVGLGVVVSFLFVGCCLLFLVYK